MSIWDDWLVKNVQAGHLAGLSVPDYYTQVLAKAGVNRDLCQACRGCCHLKHTITRDKSKRVVTDFHRCTLWGGESNWQPGWPACSYYDTGSMGKQDLSSLKGAESERQD